jgi:hypothetical protein
MHDYNHGYNRHDYNHDNDNNKTITGSKLMDKIWLFLCGVTVGVVLMRVPELFELGIWGW